MSLLQFPKFGLSTCESPFVPQCKEGYLDTFQSYKFNYISFEYCYAVLIFGCRSLYILGISPNRCFNRSRFLTLIREVLAVLCCLIHSWAAILKSCMVGYAGRNVCMVDLVLFVSISVHWLIAGNQQ